MFSDTDVLLDELQSHVDAPVEFYVYSSDTDEVRVVVLMPRCVALLHFVYFTSLRLLHFFSLRFIYFTLRSTQWGGSGGLLGADVACGYLHKLPSSCCDSIGKDCASSSTTGLVMPSREKPSFASDVHASTHEELIVPSDNTPSRGVLETVS